MRARHRQRHACCQLRRDRAGKRRDQTPTRLAQRAPARSHHGSHRRSRWTQPSMRPPKVYCDLEQHCAEQHVANQSHVYSTVRFKQPKRCDHARRAERAAPGLGVEVDRAGRSTGDRPHCDRHGRHRASFDVRAFQALRQRLAHRPATAFLTRFAVLRARRMISAGSSPGLPRILSTVAC